MYKLYKVGCNLLYINIVLNELYAFRTKESYYELQDIVDGKKVGLVHEMVGYIDEAFCEKWQPIYEGDSRNELLRLAWANLSCNEYRLYRNGNLFFITSSAGVFLWDNNLSTTDNMTKLKCRDNFLEGRDLKFYLIDCGFKYVRSIIYTCEDDFILELKKGMR